MTNVLRYGLLLGGLFLTALPARAQLQEVRVDIEIKRNLYLRYEPIVCKVTITNMSGRTLDLSDTPRDKWFGFQIETTDGRPLPPLNSTYHNEPLQLENGQKLSRRINITPLFPLSEFGTYRVRGAVFSHELGRYFTSGKLNVDITEGRQLWQQRVGIPPGSGDGASRTYTLLSHRLPETTVLYLRIEDEDEGVVYCTTQIGRLVTFGKPDVEIDNASQIHILQNIAPKAFLYSHFDVNGKVIKQQGYQAANTRPYLVRKNNAIEVIGGVPYDTKEPTAEQKVPKLSDRPVPLPTPKSKASPTPDEKRPENLLSR